MNFSENALVNYEFIGDDYIHIKIGGDHGGRSFKFVYEICNVKNPNAITNTVVIAYFEAKVCSNLA